MNIISKYKDYYDSVVGQTGIDKTIVFERHIQELTFSVRAKGIKSWWSPARFPSYEPSIDKIGSKHFELFVVGFCGKIYIGAKVTSTVAHPYRLYETEKLVTYVYGIEKIKSSICNYMRDDRYFQHRKDPNMEHIESFVNKKDVLELFYAYKTPQFVLYNRGEDNLKINGSLKDVQFYKVFDPYQALQEIEMYVTGVLGANNKPMIEISDEHKIVGHGFDPKYSFRKEPENKNNK